MNRSDEPDSAATLMLATARAVREWVASSCRLAEDGQAQRKGQLKAQFMLKLAADMTCELNKLLAATVPTNSKTRVSPRRCKTKQQQDKDSPPRAKDVLAAAVRSKKTQVSPQPHAKHECEQSATCSTTSPEQSKKSLSSPLLSPAGVEGPRVWRGLAGDLHPTAVAWLKGPGRRPVNTPELEQTRSLGLSVCFGCFGFVGC